MGEARTAAAEIVSISRQLEDFHAFAGALDTLASLLLLERRCEEALVCAREALAVFRDLKDSEGEALSLGTIVSAHLEACLIEPVKKNCFVHSAARLQRVAPSVSRD